MQNILNQFSHNYADPGQKKRVEHKVEMKRICLIKDLLIYNTTLYNVEHIAI